MLKVDGQMACCEIDSFHMLPFWTCSTDAVFFLDTLFHRIFCSSSFASEPQLAIRGFSRRLIVRATCRTTENRFEEMLTPRSIAVYCSMETNFIMNISDLIL